MFTIDLLGDYLWAGERRLEPRIIDVRCDYEKAKGYGGGAGHWRGRAIVENEHRWSCCYERTSR